MRSKAFAATMVFIFSAALGGGAVEAGTSVRFRLVSGYLPTTSVWVSGSGPYGFVLDTGTSATMIDRELAEQLGLQPVDQASLFSAMGSRTVPRARLRSFTVGPKSVENLTVPLTDLGEIRSLDRRIRGLVGQNFLSRFDYLLDYRRELIEFADGGEWDERLIGIRLPFEMRAGKVFVTAQPTSGKKRDLRLMLDSGAPKLVLFKSRSEEFSLTLIAARVRG